MVPGWHSSSAPKTGGTSGWASTTTAPTPVARTLAAFTSLPGTAARGDRVQPSASQWCMAKSLISTTANSDWAAVSHSSCCWRGPAEARLVVEDDGPGLGREPPRWRRPLVRALPAEPSWVEDAAEPVTVSQISQLAQPESAPGFHHRRSVGRQSTRHGVTVDGELLARDDVQAHEASDASPHMGHHHCGPTAQDGGSCGTAVHWPSTAPQNRP